LAFFFYFCFSFFIWARGSTTSQSPSPSKEVPQQTTMGQGTSQDTGKDAGSRDPKPPNEKDNSQAPEKPKRNKGKKKREPATRSTIQATKSNEVARPSLGPFESMESHLFV
jgi:hypothetical protein